MTTPSPLYSLQCLPNPETRVLPGTYNYTRYSFAWNRSVFPVPTGNRHAASQPPTTVHVAWFSRQRPGSLLSLRPGCSASIRCASTRCALVGTHSPLFPLPSSASAALPAQGRGAPFSTSLTFSRTPLHWLAQPTPMDTPYALSLCALPGTGPHRKYCSLSHFPMRSAGSGEAERLFASSIAKVPGPTKAFNIKCDLGIFLLECQWADILKFRWKKGTKIEHSKKEVTQAMTRKSVMKFWIA